MGLFGKLFDKKECSVCGGEIGLLGNRKLEDGNLCKHCAKKLSPWFEDRRHSTVADIEKQLVYREQNFEALKGFQPKYRIGEDYKLIAEEQGGVPTRFVVTDGDYMEENADLIAFANVSSCNIDVDETSRELTRQNDKGETVSYNPPRYEYSYNFYVKMTIENNPYFDDIRFKLNNFSVDVNPDTLGRMPGQSFTQVLFGQTAFDPSMHPEYGKFMQMCNQITELVNAGRSGGYQQPVYAQEAVEQPAPGPKFCPNCGAPAEGGKFCVNCGSKL